MNTNQEDFEVTVVEDHEIYHAIEAGNEVLVGQMMRENPKVLAMSAAMWDGTPLICAILYAGENGENKVAMYMLAHECSQYWEAKTQTITTNYSYKGMTPLIAAIRAEQPDIVKALVERGADVTEPNLDCGHTPLILAAVRQSPAGQEILRYLLTFPAARATLGSLSESDAGDMTTVLGEACSILSVPCPSVIRMLLDAGADASGADGGTSPLQMLRRPRNFARNHTKCPRKQAEEFARLDQSEALLRASIDESVRARCLFRARFIDDTGKAIPAAAEDARKKGLNPSAQQQKALDATPGCLEARMREHRPLPTVDFHITPAPPPTSPLATLNEDGDWGWDGATVIALLGQLLDGETSKVFQKAVTELEDDVFEELMEMMVPPGDSAWKGEKMGNLLKRLENNNA